MKAVRILHDKPTLVEIPSAPVGPDEALVEVELVGICGTDHAIADGYLSFAGTLGHEFVGRVIQCDTNPDWLGRRVVADINESCGRCRLCLKGLGNHCVERSALGISRDGAMAEFVVVRSENLVEVPDQMPSTDAIFAEPLAAALALIRDVQIDKGADVLLIGAGRLGQLIARAIKLRPCRLTVCAKHDTQCASLDGIADEIVTPDGILTNRFDITIDASGTPGGLNAAIEAVRPRGIVVAKSTYIDRVPVNMTRIVVNEIQLVGSRCGSVADAIEAIASGGIQLGSLINARFPKHEVDAAFRASKAPDTLKVLIEFTR